MRILFGTTWKDGFLDYFKSPEEYRIKVRAWKTLEELKDVYHIRPKSVRLLLNYLPVVGPGGVFRKVWSRLREHYRNQKYVSCGVGEIIEAAEGGKFKKGDVVGFAAPLHPALVERITLPEEFLCAVEPSTIPEVPSETILYLPEDKDIKESHWWKDIRGWSIYSGIPVSAETKNNIAEGIRTTIADAPWDTAQHISTETHDTISEVKGTLTTKIPRKKSGILFGYGNYAKINIIPYTKPYVHIQNVHEIDPTEMLWEGNVTRWDTAPVPRKGEGYDVYFIASYNHTHVPIAVHALEQGAHVVMEKPIASDKRQLDALTRALEQGNSELFIGFQKRYSVFNDFARKDLNVAPGDPISYHCVVFEIIQPEFFWYNWPNSGSRLFSNGCHLVDHFLYLNEWSEPTTIDLALSKEGEINVWLELKNGAFFTMAFSEKGSSRVGPRDHIELKTPGRNVRITDATRYFSEDEKRIIRRVRVPKTEAYKKMYKTIARKIAHGEKGDSLRSVVVSAKTMLIIEEKLQSLLKKV